MTKLLLDHPWPLDAALDGSSPAHLKLQKFQALIHGLGVAAVPFVTQQERDESLERLGQYRNWTAAAAIKRFSDELIYRGANLQQAAVDRGPVDLGETWLRSLHDEIHGCTNWRVPQIIFIEARRDDWPPRPTRLEVDVTCGAKSVSCVLAPLEDFEVHRYALSDIDPWKQNASRLAPQPGDIRPYPCWLPRHPAFEEVPLEQIRNHLATARRTGWKIGDKHYYIPPNDYDPLTVSKQRWRSGRAFPHKDDHQGHGGGYEDCEGRIWVWARAPAGGNGQRHWDVQEHPGWKNVSHDGDEVEPH